MQGLADRCRHAAQPDRAQVADARESEPTRFDHPQSCPVVPALTVSDFHFTGATRF